MVHYLERIEDGQAHDEDSTQHQRLP